MLRRRSADRHEEGGAEGQVAERGRRGTAGKRHQKREMGFSLEPEDRTRFGQDSMPSSGTVAVPGWQYGAILRAPAPGSALHRSRSKHI